MARSIYGNLTGRAAAENLRDLRDYNDEMWLKEQKQKQIDRENRLYVAAMEYPTFESFWNTVPDFGKRTERIVMLQAFIASEYRLNY